MKYTFLNSSYAAPFVLVERSSSNVAGYYTLSATSMNLGDLPDAIAKKLPDLLVPAFLLGRLAIDKNYRGKGLGEMLLMDVLYHSLRTEIAATSVLVDAPNHFARSFYEHYQFIASIINSFVLQISQTDCLCR